VSALEWGYSNPPEPPEAVLRRPREGSSTRQRAPNVVLPEVKRLGNGVVHRAVVRALEADRAMDAGEAQTALEA
jgi:hypothetical protein